MGSATTSSSTAGGPERPLPGARHALLLLIIINLFNYIDRYILAAVLPKVHDAFLVGDPNANQKLGWLTTMFLVAYMVASPIFGLLADRWARWYLVAFGVIVWSLASGASGLAGDLGPLNAYWILLLTRCFVGVGEAAYGPVAPTVISDYYPMSRRGSVLAWFYMAIPVGGALGYLLGGFVADSSWLTQFGVDPLDRWRWAFYLVVPPGILLGIWCLFMREPARGQAYVAGSARKPSFRDYLTLARTPSYVLNTAGMTAMTFAIGGVSIWMPKYLYEREARFCVNDASIERMSTGKNPVAPQALARLAAIRDRVFDSKRVFAAELESRLPPEEWSAYRERLLDETRELRLGEINLYFGGLVAVAGLAATLLGGITGDRLRPRWEGSYFLVSSAGMFVGLPMFLLIMVTPLPWSWGFIFLSVFCLFFNTGPTNTVLANVTHPRIRASAFALNILIIHALGDAISPPIIGAIADAFEAREYSPGAALGMAFQIISVMIVLSGLFWLAGSRFLARDTELAPTRIAG